MGNVPTMPELFQVLSERTGVPLAQIDLDRPLAALGLGPGGIRAVLEHFERSYALTFVPHDVEALLERPRATVRDLYRVLQ